MVKTRIVASVVIGILSIFKAYSAPADSIQHNADGENLLAFNVEARLDGQYVSDAGKTNHSQSGFMGKYIAIKAQGTIINGLSYTWRQRFSRTPKDGSFWDQTDILSLSYQKNKWDVGAGKQVVMIGGYEYDRAPIDLMCPNLFVSNVACYQFGVSGGYQITPHDHLALQVSQSIFATASDRDLFAYNLYWNSSRDFGNHLKFETIWSVNEIEYARGKFCNYVALGNKLIIDKNFSVIVDLMTRSYPGNRAFKNNTFMIEGAWDFKPKWRATVKASYDCNLGTNQTAMTEVAQGTELGITGALLEWFPIQNKRHLLRAHAGVFYSFGKNTNDADMMQSKTLYASIGLTWHMNLLNIKRKGN